MWINLLEIIQLWIILLVSIWLHEYAHAYVSYKLWDPTPKLQWRLTPNPIKHLDPIWFLMIFLINFWRWKPVQVNPMYYKNPLKWELIVALAWPATNLVLATIWVLIILIYSKFLNYPITSILQTNTDIVNLFRLKFSIINIALAIFNMIPLPPLDWFRIIKMLRFKAAQIIEKYTIYISIAFLLIILWPGQNVIWSFLSNTSFTIFSIIFTIFWNIFY